MSTPTRLSRSSLGFGDGKRIILKEITADLQNSPMAMISPKKAGTEPVKPEHEVKVKFAREFIDAPSESISSASSFQSLASSLSAKSSSPSTDPASFSESIADTTYVNSNVSGLDDLAAALAGVRLDDGSTSANHSLTDIGSWEPANQSLDRTVDISRCYGIKVDKPLDETSFLSESLTLPSDEEKLQTQCLNVTTTLNCDSVISPKHQVAPEFHLALSSEVPHLTFTPDPDLNITKSPVNSVSDVTFPINDNSKQASDLSHQTFHQISPSETTFVSGCPSLSTLPNICGNISGEVNESLPPNKVERRRSQSPLLVEGSQQLPDRKTPSGIADHCELTTSESPFVDNQKASEISAKSAEHDFLGGLIEKSFEGEKTTEGSVVNNPSRKISPRSVEVDLLVSPFKENTPVKESVADQTFNIIPPCGEEVTKKESSFIESENRSTPVEVVPCFEGSLNSQVFQGNPQNSVDLKNIISLELDKTITDAPEVEQYEAFVGSIHQPIHQSTEISQPSNALDVPDNITNFLPTRQSTGLDDLIRSPEKIAEKSSEELVKTPEKSYQDFFDAQDKTPVAVPFDELHFEAEKIAADILNASLHVLGDTEEVSGGAVAKDLFRDPSSFDFLENQRSVQTSVDRLRESLFVKFDPLVSNNSMLPQDNTATSPEERNGDKEGVPINTTPKRSPAIAAIDRLLFYSPMPVKEQAEKIQAVEKPPEPTPIVDTAMAKELEVVRSTVLQLEDQLQNEKEKRVKMEKQLEEQALTIVSLQESSSQLQKRLDQEAEAKKEFNMVLDRYEKSMEDMVAARLYDKTLLEASDKELQETKNHLIASEAAFNDVHAKYERLKVVLMTMKGNETAWKDALEENIKTIKALDFRYEEIKKHATDKLEFANKELDRIEKKYAAEKMKLEAMLKKEELKSNSLADIVSQKTKENIELTQILDDLIARVGPNRDE